MTLYKGARENFLEGLTQDQQDAFTCVVRRVEDKHKITKLVGYAGTGKTFLLARIARYLSDLGYQVTIAAPTHKAVGVIREKLGSIDVETSTIHSLLGLRLERDMSNDAGGKILRAKSNGELHGVVICDEGSMVGTVLREQIEKKAHMPVQWIFVGDNAQLPPVGENVSELLENPDATLSKIVRQQEDSEILDLATRIRNGDRGALVNSRIGRDVVRLRTADDLFEAAHELFTSPAYDQDCSHARMIVFRNRVREEINQKMRRLVVGSPVEYAAKEWLVLYEQFTSPGELQDDAWRCFTIPEMVERLKKMEELAREARHYYDKTGSKALWQRFFEYRDEQPTISFHTSQEVRVEAAYEGRADIDEPWFPKFDIWLLNIRSEGHLYRSIPVLKRSEKERHKQALASLTCEAVDLSKRRDKEPKHSSAWKDLDAERTEVWQRFYLLKEIFAQVDYAFAMTTHKAQGSTFEHVFVDMPDLMSSPKPMRQRLLYTAVTRPSKTLTFYYA